MDFATMKNKINCLQYETLSDFEADLRLIITNCLRFNRRETIFYKAALKLRSQVIIVYKCVLTLLSLNYLNCVLLNFEVGYELNLIYINGLC